MQGYPGLHSEFETNFSYMRPYLKKKKQKVQKDSSAGKGAAARTDDLGLVPGSNMGKGENTHTNVKKKKVLARYQVCVMVHVFNPSTQKAETGQFL